MRLIDADKLVNDLMRLKQDYIDCDYDSKRIDGVDDCIEEVGSMAAVPQFGQWISVKDRLPEYQEKVLCFYENGFMGTAVFYGISTDPHRSSNNFVSYSHNFMTEGSKIKFWMPLPEEPSKEKAY